LCCKKTYVQRNKKLMRQAFYKVGEKKLKNELDCVSLIKSVRLIKILTKILLTGRQQMLIRF
jgi:hypothetical protein